MGELELDISFFMNSAGDTKTLNLNKALPNSRIELQISIQKDDGHTSLLGKTNLMGNSYIDDSSDDEEKRGEPLEDRERISEYLDANLRKVKTITNMTIEEQKNEAAAYLNGTSPSINEGLYD